jgi:hypothetical protein
MGAEKYRFVEESTAECKLWAEQFKLLLDS